MVIWTIKEGEPLPILECPGRQMRTGIVSEMLAERGHDVTWWSSDFFHQKRIRIKDNECTIELRNNYRLKLLHAKTLYKNSISIFRLFYSRQLGRAFINSAENMKEPDVIYCSYPLIDFAYEAVKYGVKNDIPVVVDVRDFWPDIFWEYFSNSVVSLFVKMACNPLIKKVKYIFENADSVIGVVPKVEEFVRKYNRRATKYDDIFFLAYKENDYSDEELNISKLFWKNNNINSDDFIICWIGQISTQRTDFQMVADVVKELPDCKFVICGDGVSKKELEVQYQNFPNIILPGFLDQVYLETLMRMSSIGVIPIRNTEDFIDALNNKVIEYMAGSLCVATSLKGLQRRIIEENNLGFYFEDREQFRKKVCEFKTNPEALLRIKKNSRDYYEMNFKSEKVYGKLCDLIEKMVLTKNDERDI